jgi:hypothetical protein
MAGAPACGFESRKGEEMTHGDKQSIDLRVRYVGYATHCLELAKTTTDQKSRNILREMAAEWLKLAEAPID